MINILCGFHQIVIWTKLKVLLEDNFDALVLTMTHVFSLYFCEPVCLSVGVLCVPVLCSHLAIPIHSPGFGFTDTSWGDRQCCVHVCASDPRSKYGFRKCQLSSPVQARQMETSGT